MHKFMTQFSVACSKTSLIHSPERESGLPFKKKFKISKKKNCSSILKYPNILAAQQMKLLATDSGISEGSRRANCS